MTSLNDVSMTTLDAGGDANDVCSFTDKVVKGRIDEAWIISDDITEDDQRWVGKSCDATGDSDVLSTWLAEEICVALRDTEDVPLNDSVTSDVISNRKLVLVAKLSEIFEESWITFVLVVMSVDNVWLGADSVAWMDFEETAPVWLIDGNWLSFETVESFEMNEGVENFERLDAPSTECINTAELEDFIRNKLDVGNWTSGLGLCDSWKVVLTDKVSDVPLFPRNVDVEFSSSGVDNGIAELSVSPGSWLAVKTMEWGTTWLASEFACKSLDNVNTSDLTKDVNGSHELGLTVGDALMWLDADVAIMDGMLDPNFEIWVNPDVPREAVSPLFALDTNSTLGVDEKTFVLCSSLPELSVKYNEADTVLFFANSSVEFIVLDDDSLEVEVIACHLLAEKYWLVFRCIAPLDLALGASVFVMPSRNVLTLEPME